MQVSATAAVDYEAAEAVCKRRGWGATALSLWIWRAPRCSYNSRSESGAAVGGDGR